MQFSFRKHTLALTLVGSLVLAACSDGDVTGVEDDHGEAAQVQLVMNGSAIATFTFASNSWVGEMEVEAGQETPHIDVNFLDEDGDVVPFSTSVEFYLEVEVEDPTIAEFEQDTPGEFGGHLHGEAVGETDVRFKLMHGAIGSGHADLITGWVHAHVEAP
ncbi:MAG: hypothetical protein ACPGPI_03830 [Longimicrobiales bacterium]